MGERLCGDLYLVKLELLHLLVCPGMLLCLALWSLLEKCLLACVKLLLWQVLLLLIQKV